MSNYIREGKVEVKCKLLSSMFPEKVVFDGNSYRTNSYNSVLDLIYQETNELVGKKNGQSKKKPTLSTSVPKAGIEPARMLLRWILNPVRLPIPPFGLFDGAKIHIIFR